MIKQLPFYIKSNFLLGLSLFIACAAFADKSVIAMHYGASSDATLTNLTLNNGTLTTAFASANTNYTATVPDTFSAISITPTATDVGATIKVNGQTVTSGSASQFIAISTGVTMISAVVTAGDGVTTKTYIITINRIASNVASLSSMVLSVGTLSPVFDTNTISYTATVPSTTVAITLTPTATTAGTTIRVNGFNTGTETPSPPILLNAGPTVITVLVTSADNTSTKTYTVTVTKVVISSNANLSNIALSSGTLSPVFASATKTYTATVTNTTTGITLTPTAADAGAVIKVSGITVTSSSASQSISLNVGANTITTVVTAADGTTTGTYTITVIRAPSNNADLFNLTVSSGTLGPAFASITTTYTVAVANAQVGIIITPTVADATATVKVNGVTVASNTASQSITLNIGLNIITVQVTAQDGTTTRNYVINVNRVAGSNANLTNLSLSTGTLTPDFAAATTNYTVAVPNTTTALTVTPIAADASASIKINGTVVNNGSASGSLALSVGANIITILVTAQDATTTKSYIITITRVAATVAEPPVTTTKVPVFVHQAVSPDDDGKNDFLKIDGIDQYPDNILLLVDRNGRLIYTGKGYNNTTVVFDGRDTKGKLKIPGTYFYSLEYKQDGQTIHKSGFIVIRY